LRRRWLTSQTGLGHGRWGTHANGGGIAPANGEAPLVNLDDEVRAGVQDSQLCTRNDTEFSQLIGQEVRPDDLDDDRDSMAGPIGQGPL
jgi:hypothetical protein